MSKKDFKRGVDAAISANTAFMHKQAEATAELGKRIVQKIDEQGKIIDVILDTLNEQEKKELYDLQSEYNIADLGDNEKEVLASYLLTLISKYGQDSDCQKDYYFAVKKHLGVTDVSPDLNLSLVENVDSKSELKAMLQTVCEFLFLKTGDSSFLDKFEDEIEYFGLSRKAIHEIIDSIEKIYAALGLRGIVEHYIPAEPECDNEQPQNTKSKTVLDWIADKDFCLQNGVKVDYFDRPSLELTRDCIVRNFPSLNIRSASIIDCLFENCDKITIDECFVTGCEFKNIAGFSIDDTKIEDTLFEGIYYDEEDDGYFCIDDVTFNRATFRKVKLTNDAYLFVAYGRCDVKNSKFINVFTDRSDMELSEYECSDGKGIFKLSYSLNLFDKKSCLGLDKINVITMDDIAGDVCEEAPPVLPFKMTIEGVTKISGRDPIIWGKIHSGTIKKGQTVDVHKKNGEIISITVNEIHNHHRWVTELSAKDVDFSTSLSVKINTKGKRLAKGDVLQSQE